MNRIDIHNTLPPAHPGPFKVPDGFFTDMEERVLHAVEGESIYEPQAMAEARLLLQSDRHRRRNNLLSWGMGIAAAATVALLITAGTGMMWQTPAMPVLNAEQAFNNLSESDQDFLIDSYSYQFEADETMNL